MNIRPACVDTDVPAITEICRVCDPPGEATEDMVRAWFERDSTPGRIVQRLVAVNDDDHPMGYGLAIHEPWMSAGSFYVWVGVLPEAREKGTGRAMADRVFDFARGHDAVELTSDVMDTDAAGQAFAERRGFGIDRHLFDSILDLTTFDDAAFQPVIDRLEAEGIRFCSLADFPDTPETTHKFYELNFATVVDIPGEDWTEEDYKPFFEQRILGSPRFRRENQLLAVDGETWTGMAMLVTNEKEHTAYNNTTGVIRPYRGRKLALALKVLAARFVRARGALSIQTDNDSLNAPILAVNRKMGYQPRPGKYTLLRKL